MSLHDDFTAALLAPEQACPDGLFSSNGADPASRFAVYRNNVHSALINALVKAYPVTLQLVGDEFFRAMASVYVQGHAPTSPLISEYGSTLADFIQGFEPAASVPYLADIARLERLRVCAYHASDSHPLDQQAVLLALQDQADLGALRLQLHPSVGTLDSAYAVVTVGGAPDRGRPGDPGPVERPECAGIAPRPGGQGFRHQSKFSGVYQQPGPRPDLRKAVEHALDASPDFDLHRCLTLLISHSAITHLHLKHKVSP